MYTARLLLLCSLVLLPTQLRAAVPTLARIFPAGGKVGSTVAATVTGTFDAWPTQVWVSDSGITATPTKEKGKLTFKIADQVSAGLHWVRLVDKQGASEARPFLVGTLAESLEQEPNNLWEQAKTLTEPALVLNGRLDPAGDVDCFRVSLTKGQTLVASLEAFRTLGSPMDAVLEVLSPKGFVVEKNHDQHDLDPQLSYTASEAGLYTVRLFAFPSVPDSSIRFAGGETYLYRLTLTTLGYAEACTPLAFPDSGTHQAELLGWNLDPAKRKVSVSKVGTQRLAELMAPSCAGRVPIRFEPHACLAEQEPNPRTGPQVVTLPATLTGRIEKAGDTDAYQLSLKKGQRLHCVLEARKLGFALDAVLKLYDATGKVLMQQDDVGGRTGARDPELTYTAKLDEVVVLEVLDLHGHGGGLYLYRLRLLLDEQDYELKLATDRFVLAPNKPTDVVVQVDRKPGFVGDVEVRLLDLPDSIEVMPITSVGKGTTAKSVTLKLLVKKGPWAGPFRVQGTVKEQPTLLRIAEFAPAVVAGAPPAPLQPLTTFWASVSGS